MRRITAYIGAVLLLVFCSAAGNDQKPDSNNYVPSGRARLYLLRPAFSEVSRDDKPLASINGVEIMQLSYNSYTSVILKPGSYEIATSAGLNEPEFWNGKVNVSVESDKAYFLAIWNDITVGAGSLSGATEFMKRAGGLIGALLGSAIDHNARSIGVRYELISEADATSVLKDMAHILPKKEQLEP